MKPFAPQIALLGVVLSTLLVGGCSEPADSGGPSEMDQLARMLDQPKQETPPTPPAARPQRRANPEPTSPPVTATSSRDKSPSEPSQVSTEPERKISRVKSGGNRPGVVGKRKYRNEHRGPLRYYGAIATVRVLAEDRALGWQIRKSMDFYVNTHDGKYPKDLDEYMKEIVEPNMIELPELRAGEEFYYDPQDHELKIVERVEAPAEEAEAGEATAPAQ